MRDLLRAAPLIDGHNDLLWALRERRLKGGREWTMPDLTLERPEFQTDLVRLEAGGVRGQFWSVYVPSDLPGHEAVTATLEQIDALLDLIRRYPERMELAHSAADVERIAASGRVASMIGVEGGQSIGCSSGPCGSSPGSGWATSRSPTTTTTRGRIPRRAPRPTAASHDSARRWSAS